MSRLYLSNPCAFSFYPLHTVLRVPAGARPSLRPLFERGPMKLHTPGKKLPREREAMLARTTSFSTCLPAGVIYVTAPLYS
jgi:hypothetical protein